MTPSFSACGRFRGNRRVMMVVILSAYFFIGLNFTVLTVLIPRIAKQFNATIEQAQWVTIGPMLVSTTLAPSLGTVADQFQRRSTIWWLGFGIHIFALGLAGLANSLPVLLFARVLSGVASACDGPTGIAILMAGIAPDQRGRIGATRSAVSTVAPSLGVSAGALIAEAFGWRVIFLGPLVPLALIYLVSLLVLPFDGDQTRRTRGYKVVGAAETDVQLKPPPPPWSLDGGDDGDNDDEEDHLEEEPVPAEPGDKDLHVGDHSGPGIEAEGQHLAASRTSKSSSSFRSSTAATTTSINRFRQRFDWAGTVVFIIGTGSGLVGISRGNDLGWGSGVVIALFAVSAANLMALYPIERYCAARPIIPGFLFTDMVIVASNGVMVLASCAYMSTLMLLPTFLQEAEGFSESFTGFLVFLRPGIGTCASTVIARVMDRSPNGLAGATLVRFGAALLVAAYTLCAATVTWAPRAALPPLIVTFVVLQPLAHYPVQLGSQSMALRRVQEGQLSQFMSTRGILRGSGNLIAVTVVMATVRVNGPFTERSSYAPVFWSIVGVISVVLPIVFVKHCCLPGPPKDFYRNRTSRCAWLRMACGGGNAARSGSCCAAGKPDGAVEVVSSSLRTADGADGDSDARGSTNRGTTTLPPAAAGSGTVRYSKVPGSAVAPTGDAE